MGLYPQHRLVNPRQHRPERVVVEGIHAVVAAKAFFDSIRIPAFPDGRRALRDRIQPRRVRCLPDQTVHKVRVPARKTSSLLHCEI